MRVAFELTCAFLAGAFTAAGPCVMILAALEMSPVFNEVPVPASMGFGLLLLGLGFALMLLAARRTGAIQ